MTTRQTTLLFRQEWIPETFLREAHLIGGPLGHVEHITIHNTAEPFSAETERARVARRRDGRQASFHYAVDETGAVELVPPSLICWHAGDGSDGPGNRSGLAIEICRSACRGERSGLYDAAEANGILLAAFLLNRYHLPLSALHKHQDWSGKFCPHRILEANGWTQFTGRVKAAMEAPPALIPWPENPSASGECGAMLSRQEDSWHILLEDGTECRTPAEVRSALPDGAGLLLSAWEEQSFSRWQNLLAEFETAGIIVTGFYVPISGQSPWMRQDLIHSAETESAL